MGKRAEKITGELVRRKRGPLRKMLLIGAGLAAAAVPLVVGMPTATPRLAQNSNSVVLKFEVSSLKASPSGRATVDSGGVGLVYSPSGRITGKNVSVKEMIEAAYRLEDFQISGGPDWINSSMMITDNRYNLEAKAAGDSTKDEINQMLQSLLVDRFKLQFHREAKEMPTYDLVLAKTGPRLKQVEGKTWSDMRILGGGGHMRFEAASVAEFIGWLSGAANHRTIKDKTGLAGRFTFTLDYTPEVFRSGKAPGATAEGQIDPSGISIFTALQEQLGLRLVASKGQVETLIIDSISKPTEN